MPGFIGVRAGEMVTIPPETDFPDIYVLSSPMAIYTAEPVFVERTDPEGHNPDLLWSFLSVKEVHAFADGKHYTSLDAGKTWGSESIPTATPIRLAMGPDSLYGWVDGGPIRRSVTGGATWFDVVPLPADHTGFGQIIASSTTLYFEVQTISQPDIYYCGRNGEGLTRLVNQGADGVGQLVGQCSEDAVLIWQGTTFELFDQTKPLQRFVGGAGTNLDLPTVWTQGIPPNDFRTYAGCQFHGTTAILAMVEQIDGDHFIHVYRSTNEGVTWTEVDTYPVEFAFKFETFDIVYNGETQGAWWHNFGEEAGGPGLKHSTDDGLTWTFISGGGIQPRIFSAGRPTNHMA